MNVLNLIYASMCLLSVLYIIFTLLLLAGMARASTCAKTGRQPFVSVVIAARNEEAVIISCLTAAAEQDYPSGMFEIIAVDDRSVDRTGELMRQFSTHRHNVTIISIQETPPGYAPKKIRRFKKV